MKEQNSKDKFLAIIKNELIEEYSNNSTKLEDMAQFYYIISVTKNNMIEEIIDMCNKYYPYSRYDQSPDDEDYYLCGTLNINFTETPYNYNCHSDNSYLDFNYELKFINYIDGKDNKVYEIRIQKIFNGETINNCYNYSEGESIFQEWYNQLEDLQKQDTNKRLNDIDKQIENLLKEKENLNSK